MGAARRQGARRRLRHRRPHRSQRAPLCHVRRRPLARNAPGAGYATTRGPHGRGGGARPAVPLRCVRPGVLRRRAAPCDHAGGGQGHPRRDGPCHGPGWPRGRMGPQRPQPVLAVPHEAGTAGPRRRAAGAGGGDPRRARSGRCRSAVVLAARSRSRLRAPLARQSVRRPRAARRAGSGGPALLRPQRRRGTPPTLA